MSERDALRAQLERLRNIGAQFANAAYNLSQLERGDMTPNDRAVLKRLQVEWDAALSTPPAEATTAEDEWCCQDTDCTCHQ